MLTLGNPSPCLSLYPCLPAESRPKMTGWSDFRVRGRRLGGGALGPQGRSRVRHGHHKINSSHRSWCHPPQRDRPLQYGQLQQQQKQEYPTCLLVHTVVKCPASGFSLLTFHSQPSLALSWEDGLVSTFDNYHLNLILAPPCEIITTAQVKGWRCRVSDSWHGGWVFQFGGWVLEFRRLTSTMWGACSTSRFHARGLGSIWFSAGQAVTNPIFVGPISDHMGRFSLLLRDCSKLNDLLLFEPETFRLKAWWKETKRDLLGRVKTPPWLARQRPTSPWHGREAVTLRARWVQVLAGATFSELGWQVRLVIRSFGTNSGKDSFYPWTFEAEAFSPPLGPLLETEDRTN